MDFEDTAEEAAYRGKVRGWLESNAPKVRGYGAWHSITEDELENGRRWQKTKADNRYAQITWPEEWGGGGGTVLENVIFKQEETRLGIHLGNPFDIGLQMCLPAVMLAGDEATKARFCGPALRGEKIWCQLFSEPSAGSDLAGIRTRAVRDGDSWTVNGGKIWTSGAHYSDYGLLLARTNPDVPKHKGLTMFWVDMKSPGLEIRPIHQMAGGSHFNQVFFTDLKLDDSQRLGAEGEGWKWAMVTLAYERGNVGASGRDETTNQLMQLAKQLETLTGGSALEDPALREKLADWYVQAEGVRLTGLRTVTALSRGQAPGPESAIGKLVISNRSQDLANEAVQLQDQFGLIRDADVAIAGGAYQGDFLSTPGFRIASGTDEILRNNIAERILGLPQEIRTDKDVPFRDLK